MLKRVILSLLALIILTHSVFVPVAHAQSPWYSQSFPDWYTKVYDTNFSPSSEIFGERYTAAQVQWVIWGLVSFFMNLPTPDHPEIWAGVMSGNIAQSIQGISTVFSDLTSYIPPTQQGPTQTLLATLLSNPVSGLGYFKNLVSRLGIVKPAYAQGFGYTALNPIQTVWISFRNIIYGFFIIFIIVYAFMIMFRRKISPQAAVTIQSALPKLIVTLVLVTFSYAIAGFMIDLMYVLIGLVAWIAGQSIISSALSWSQVFTILTQGPTVGPISTGFVGIAFVYFITTLLTFLITFVGGFTSIWNGAQVTLAFAVLGLPATILLIFALIYITFKVFWVLLKTFINIMLLIIFSPVYIGLGALDLPGVGFGAWAKELAANLLVYPTVGLLVVLSFFFLFVAVQGSVPTILNNLQSILQLQFNIQPFTANPPWLPPLTVGYALYNVLWVLVSFGIFSLIPKVAEIIKSMITGKPLSYGSAIGEALTGPAVAFGYAVRGVQAGTAAYEAAKGRGLFGGGKPKTIDTASKSG